MQNPYSPTQHASISVPARAQWLRVVVGAMAALITFYVIVVITEVAFAYTFKQSGQAEPWVTGTVQYGSYFLLGGLIYWRVADGVYRHVVAHVLAMYVLIELVDLGLTALLGLSSFSQQMQGLAYRALSFAPALAVLAWVMWRRRAT